MATSTATGKQVLIIDDNEFNREGMAFYLHRQNLLTLEAGDENSAFEIKPSLGDIPVEVPELIDYYLAT